MAAGAQVRGWTGPSRRRVPRFLLQAPLDVTVLRSGIPDTVPGRSVNVCERGISAMLAGELVPGEAVGIEVRLSQAMDALRARALVRHQDKLRCGLEFVGLSVEQRAAIREWAKESKAETEIIASPTPAPEKKGTDPGGSSRRPKKRRRWVGWALFLILVAAAAGVAWWRWNRGGDELESEVKNRQGLVAGKAKAAGGQTGVGVEESAGLVGEQATGAGAGGSDGEVAGPQGGADLSAGGAEGKSAGDHRAGHCRGAGWIGSEYARAEWA